MGDIGRLKTNWKGGAHLRGNEADRSPESVSMVLRNARILQGYDLEEIAHSLNIRAAHLEALEEGRFSDLPPLVYAQGFVAAYADFLGENRSELVSRFREEAAGAPAPLPTIAQFNLNTQPDAAERRIPSTAVIIAGFVLVALAYGLWQAALPDRRDEVLAVPPLPTRFAEEAFANIPATTAQAATRQPAAPVVAAAPAAPVAAPVPAAPPAPAAAGAGVITLRARGETWAHFSTPQGQRVSSLMLRAGRTYSIPASYRGYKLSVGNLASVQIVVDGRPVPQRNMTGRADVTLDPARLIGGNAVLN